MVTVGLRNTGRGKNTTIAAFPQHGSYSVGGTTAFPPVLFRLPVQHAGFGLPAAVSAAVVLLLSHGKGLIVITANTGSHSTLKVVQPPGWVPVDPLVKTRGRHQPAQPTYCTIVVCDDSRIDRFRIFGSGWTRSATHTGTRRHGDTCGMVALDVE